MLDWRTKTGISAVSGDHTFGRAALQTGGMETLLRVARAETGVLSLLFLFPNLRIGLVLSQSTLPICWGRRPEKSLIFILAFDSIAWRPAIRACGQVRMWRP